MCWRLGEPLHLKNITTGKASGIVSIARIYISIWLVDGNHDFRSVKSLAGIDQKIAKATLNANLLNKCNSLYISQHSPDALKLAKCNMKGHFELDIPIMFKVENVFHLVLGPTSATEANGAVRFKFHFGDKSGGLVP